MLEHLGQGQDLTGGVVVVNGAVAQVVGLAGVEGRIHGGDAGIQTDGHGERLEGRAHLEHRGRRAVELLIVVGDARLVGVEVRPAGQAQHLAGADIGDNAHGAARLELRHGPVQFVFQRRLDAQVDRQGDIARLLGLGADILVEGAFHPGQACAAAVGEADQVRGRGAPRIDAPLVILERQAGQAQVMDAGA